MKKLYAAAVACGLILTLAPAAQADEPPLPPLAEILLADGDLFDSNQNDFDIVTQAILACSELAGPAGDPEAALTVFLPTDKAFRILVDDLFEVSIKDEAELFGAIAAALGCDAVEAVLQYHIAPGVFPAADLIAAGDGAMVPTLLGLPLEVDFKGKGQIRLVDGTDSLRDPIIRATDIEASNGVAHVLDRVLVPPLD